MVTVNDLKTGNIFKDTDERVVNLLVSIAQKRNIPAGVPVFVEDMISDAMFIILSGSVDVLKKTNNGRENIIGNLEKGDAFGMLSLILDTKRFVTVRAREPLEVIVITRDNFNRLVNDNIHAAYQILLSITRHIAGILGDPKGMEGVFNEE